MANEITVTTRVSISNGNFKQKFDPGTVQIDQAAIGGHSPVVIVGHAAEEDLALGDLSTPGLVALRNLDATNFVKYGPKDGTMVEFSRIKAGETAVFRLGSSVTLRWQADTADVKVQVMALED